MIDCLYLNRARTSSADQHGIFTLKIDLVFLGVYRFYNRIKFKNSIVPIQTIMGSDPLKMKAEAHIPNILLISVQTTMLMIVIERQQSNNQI